MLWFRQAWPGYGSAAIKRAGTPALQRQERREQKRCQRGLPFSFSVAHPKAERGDTAGAWISTDSRFPATTGRGKETSTATTWKASEERAPALRAPARGCGTRRRPRRGWAEAAGGAGGHELRVPRDARGAPNSHVNLHYGYPERGKTRGTSERIQGVSTDFLENGLWPIWSRKILGFYFKEFIGCKLVKVLKKKTHHKKKTNTKI